ncbi:MAG: ASCH domain-containing protein [Nitrososphaeraceae archaeon]
MKCLSLKQPYADLLVSGKKIIELRTWNTKFRGEFLVHASKKIDKEACKMNKIDPDSLIAGAVIGKAILYDVKFYKNRISFVQDRNKHMAGTKYTDHKYGFLVKNARRFKSPLIIPGKLGFFNVDYAGLKDPQDLKIDINRKFLMTL